MRETEREREKEKEKERERERSPIGGIGREPSTIYQKTNVPVHK